MFYHVSKNQNANLFTWSFEKSCFRVRLQETLCHDFKCDLLRHKQTKKHESNVGAAKESTKITQFLRLMLLHMQYFLTQDENLIICILP